MSPASTPARPQLIEALACATEMSTGFWQMQVPGVVAAGRRGVLSRGAGWVDWVSREPAEVWERLATAGLIPSDWVQAPNRRFLTRKADWRLHWLASAHLRAEPPDVATCVAFAADAPNVLACELAARELWPLWRPREGLLWGALPASLPARTAASEKIAAFGYRFVSVHGDHGVVLAYPPLATSAPPRSVP